MCTAWQAQCAQGISQQRPFFVTQALYRLWLGQDIILQIGQIALTEGGGGGCASVAKRTALFAMMLFDRFDREAFLGVEQ